MAMFLKLHKLRNLGDPGSAGDDVSVAGPVNLAESLPARCDM
ncbi:hypothetical protein R1T08_39525 [Streptomyces sp. SBC-4]|nr:hypothetical protein [Streptomyces sp. SBC-4]MDV5150023.1 hypothetical protein [Streptomyces sp. SBC-4]